MAELRIEFKEWLDKAGPAGILLFLLVCAVLGAGVGALLFIAF